MKKLFIVLFTIFCTVLIAVSIYTFVPAKQQPTQELQQTEYIIKDYGGKVAVFESNSNEPMVVYEIYTHLLPENDIELLRRGIKVADRQQLQSCLEDLGL